MNEKSRNTLAELAIEKRGLAARLAAHGKPAVIYDVLSTDFIVQ